MGKLTNIAIVGAGQAVVREAVFGVLAATGAAPLIAGATGAALTAFWTWVEGRSLLDIVVYGVAAFASLLFVVWLISRFIAELRGKPMTLAIRERLSFGEIATRWAAETASHPGALSRDEILNELLMAVWDGCFEDAQGNSRLTLVSASDHRQKEDDYGPWNRYNLLSGLSAIIRHEIKGDGIPANSELVPGPDEPPLDWVEMQKRIPWSKIKKINVDRYDELDRRAYIEDLTITKSDFRRWARDAKRRLPTFWFE